MDKESNYPQGGKSWEKARSYVKGLGHIPTIFCSAIREIKTAELLAFSREEKKELRDITLTQTRFLIRVSPSLKAVLYFAAQDIYNDQLNDTESLTVQRLVELFSPGEIASILAITYLDRAIGRKCDSQEWKTLRQRMSRHIRVGGIVGQTITNIDRSNGMLIGALRYLALGLFACEDLKKFQSYRREVEAGGELFSMEQEETLWGCNHMQVAAVLSQAMGFGSDASCGLATCSGVSFTVESDNSKDDPEGNAVIERELNDRIRCWHEAVSWTESFQLEPRR